MRARAVVIVGLVVPIALAPGTALAKGAIAANISGPGIGDGIRLNGGGESGSGTRLGELADFSGFFAQAYGMEPDPLLQGRPKGDLGPRYVVRYVMEPGDRSVVRQHIYPFAAGGPVTFMAAGQSFYGTESTRGGWFSASSDLLETLVAIGMPKVEPSSAPAVSAAQAPRAPKPRAASESSSARWLLWAIVAVAAIATAGAGARMAIRRRARSATVG